MAAEPSDFVELGEVIGGYRLERLLGAGSTSQVFLGKHVVLGRKAAIKVLVHKLIGNEDVIHRLLTEAKVVNDIRHPNIIDISDFINTPTPRRVALVMEYIEGPSLTVCRENPLTFEQAIGVMLQLITAVRAAHTAGIIHRDIKPDNLLLTLDPRTNQKEVPTLKIVDFGIAKMAHSNLAQTAVGTMLGTPAYMAPEQIAGRPRPSAATDVFAIGEVLYEVLTGKRAYPAGTISETVRAKLRGELPDLKLPPMPGDKALLDIIRRCLSNRPEDRPGLQEIQGVLESVRPGGERVQTLEDVDADASEVETRMTGNKPVPPAATTELSPMAIVHGSLTSQPPMTRLDRMPPDISTAAPTEANPIPRIRRLPKDITSPTNRVLPALTEIAEFNEQPKRGSEMPNAPTIPGTLNRHELMRATAQVVRDEQALAIGQLRIADPGGRSDDEASVQISDFDLSQLHAAPQVVFDDDDPLRIAPPPKTKPKDEILEPVVDETGLGLSQPAGIMSTLERETDLDALDAEDLNEPTPYGAKIDSAATMPPKPSPAPSQPPRPDSGPDVPDTRITQVRTPNQSTGSNRFFILLVLVIGLGTALALSIASGKLKVAQRAPVTPAEKAPPPPLEEELASGLRITSDPPGADVLGISGDKDMDPLPMGKTPITIGLVGQSGPQRLRFLHPECEPLEIDVPPGQKEISVTLRRK